MRPRIKSWTRNAPTMTSQASTLETTRRGLEDLLLPSDAKAVPIHLIASAEDAALEGLSEAERGWGKAQGFSGKQGAVLLLPDGKGGVAAVLLGTRGADGAAPAPVLAGVLVASLPDRACRLASPPPDAGLAALGFLAGSDAFTRYKAGAARLDKQKRLALPEGANKDHVLALAEALYFGSDLINTPANDMGTAELEGAAREL